MKVNKILKTILYEATAVIVTIFVAFIAAALSILILIIYLLAGIGIVFDEVIKIIYRKMKT